jgi:pimeloyl-ACP methyl ester carboxylesterase
MGAAVALTTAARYPTRVARLALLGAATRFGLHPDLLAAARAGADLAPQLMAFWGLGPYAQLGGHAAPGLWLSQAAQRLIEQGLHRSLAIDLEACGRWEASEAAPLVKCPTLVLAGSADRMTPLREGRALRGLIAGARLEILEGAGHMMMLEQPDATLDPLAAFLSEQDRA